MPWIEGLHQRLGDWPFYCFLSFELPALGDDAQAVVIEVTEAVSATLNEFHFSVEPFGDAVVFGDAPHACDFLLPASQCIGQGDQWREAAVGELSNDIDEAGSQEPALPGLLVAHAHQ